MAQGLFIPENYGPVTGFYDPTCFNYLKLIIWNSSPKAYFFFTMRNNKR